MRKKFVLVLIIVSLINLYLVIYPAIAASHNNTNLILKKKDFKLDEDIELEFTYLNDLGEQKRAYGIFERITGNVIKIFESSKTSKKGQTANDNIKALVYDYSGDLINIKPEIEAFSEGEVKIKVPKQRQLKAGKYTLKLELVKDGITYTQEQDFTWGVLAINVNKSMYLPNEDAFIGIGVLDDNGKVVCNADVTLEIIDPLNQKTILSTANNQIKVSPECQVLGITELPDYYTTYSVDGVGTYLMNLTVVTANGIRSIQDKFTVLSDVDFDVARHSATRIYPLVPYVMNISIIANQDYNGAINEYVPSSFAITPQDGLTVTTTGDTSTLSWNVDLKKDDKIELSYQYDAPDTSPEFYLLGPLDIGGFAETRSWQLASDQFAGFGYNITYPDAGAPGMNLVVQFVGSNFASSASIKTNSSGNITIGPTVVTNANGNRVDSAGKVLSTVFYIHPNATAQNVNVSINGNSWSVFQIIQPKPGSGNFSNATGLGGKYMIGNGKNGTRTIMGTIVLDSLIIPDKVTVEINTTDLDPALAGDQGKLPVHIIVDGPVVISGILNVSGFSGTAGVSTGDIAGMGGSGGPGGGGGGGGGADAAGVHHHNATGGSGFTGGGGGSCESSASCTGMTARGGNGTGSVGGRNASGTNSGGMGGNSTSPTLLGGGGAASPTAGGAGGGGGTGFFFGSSGAGGTGSGGAGGSGGGGGAASGTNGNAGGGGGFGTAGTASSGGAGSAHGNDQLVPLTGGSGGGGGGTSNAAGGGGGGGGGAVLLFATGNITINSTGYILAMGGNGGGTGGGAGSGGGIILQAFNVSLNSPKGGLNATQGLGGTAGGLGRIRIDGLEVPVSKRILGFAGSNFTGPSIKNITDTSIGGAANASDKIVVYVQTLRGTNRTFTGTADVNGTFDIDVIWYNGRNHIAVIQNSTANTYTIMSSASVATYDFTDTKNPRMNASLNNLSTDFLQGNRVNMTANVSDNNELSWCQFVDNQSLPNGAKTYFNFSFNGGIKSSMCSQNYTIALPAGSVINFTVVVNDTANNINKSEYAGGVIGQIVEVTSTPSCACPASGNWNMNLCVGTAITSNCDLNNNNAYCTTAGTITLQAKIFNFGEIRTESNCEIRCENSEGCT